MSLETEFYFTVD